MRNFLDWLKTTGGIVTAAITVIAGIGAVASFVVFHYGDGRYVQLSAYQADQSKETSASGAKDTALERRLDEMLRLHREAETRQGQALVQEVTRLSVSKADAATTELRLQENARRADKTDLKLEDLAKQQTKIIQQQSAMQSTMEAQLRELIRLSNLLEKKNSESR